MAEKYSTVLQLAADTEKKVTGSPEEWFRFMDTAGRFCKYTFQEQLLIYAQRPEAAACAPVAVWDRMGCWINRGAKDIALIDTSSPRQKLKYVFGMADVTPERRKNGRLPYIWSVKTEHEQAVIDALEAVYGKTDARYPFADRVMELMMEAAKGIYEESARKIAPYVKGSLLEGEEWHPFSVTVYGAMLESAYCEVMGACSYDNRPRNFSFHDIKYFNTHETLCMLGNEVSEFARPVIAEIGRVVREYDMHRETARTAQGHAAEKNAGPEQKGLASPPENSYNALKRESEIKNGRKENIREETSGTERGGAYGTDVQTGRGLPGARHRTLIHGDAGNVCSFLRERGFRHADYIISGLPFTSLSQQVSHRILSQTQKAIGMEGVFTTFQYTLLRKTFLENYFDIQKIVRVWRNLPRLM